MDESTATTMQAPVRVLRRASPAGEPYPWRIVVVGALAAQLFALPILSTMGWFLGSLVHEMGHAAMAWACGMPSIPAIRLDGHAAAVHGAQSAWLVWVVAGGAAYGAWAWRERVVVAGLFGAAALFVPFVAFSPALRELAFLVMGHGGELLFAGLAFYRAGQVDLRGPLECGLYATLGAYLLWKNVTLFFGLATSAEALIEYYGSGSFGLTNDLIRVAEDVLDTTVQSVAVGMLVASLLVVPGVFVARRVLRDV